MSKLVINRKQLDLLQGFYAHCYCVYHLNIKPDFKFWADLLDANDVSWSIQNSVASIAEDKLSRALYLTTHLKNKGIEVN